MSKQRQSPTEPSVSDKDYVQAFVRGLNVIRAFGPQHSRMTLTQVAELTGFPPAATRRFLLTLVRERYATTDGKYFLLTPRILDLGYAYLSSQQIWEGTQSVLAEVAGRIGESCSASVLDGDEIVYVARVAANRIMTVDLRVGSRLPAFYTSMGRVLLAHLSEADLDRLIARHDFQKLTPKTISSAGEMRDMLRRTRAQGWSLTNQELELGLLSVAVPLRDRLGKVSAAINVSSHVSRRSPQQMTREILPILSQAAERISSVNRIGSVAADMPQRLLPTAFKRRRK